MEGKQKTRRWCAWSRGLQLAPPPTPLAPPPRMGSQKKKSKNKKGSRKQSTGAFGPFTCS